MFHKRIILILFLGFTLPLVTCKLNDSESNNTADTITDPQTRIIEVEDWKDKVFMVDSSYTFSMDPAILNEYSLQTGNILLSTHGEGILRKIMAIDDTGDRLIVTTSPATLTEAYERLHFSFDEDLSALLGQAKIGYLADGVVLKENTTNGIGPDITFSLEVPLDNHLTISGDLTISPTISGEAEIDNWTLTSLMVEFELHEVFNLNLSTTQASYELNKEIDVVDISFPTILIGSVPITPVFRLSIGAEFDLKSELSVGVRQELTTTSGLQYSNGNWEPYFDFDPSFGRNGPILSNTATAKAYIKPQIDMKFYGMVSPNLSTQLYGLVEAELGTTPWWSLYGGLSSDIGIDIGVWSLNIANFSITLFDEKILIASASTTGNDPPMAIFRVNPEDGTKETTFYFNASDSRDNIDDKSDLLVRWDWEGDGIFDTDFSNDKTENHKYSEIGTYHPILEVKNINDLTSQTSKSVIVTLEPNRKPIASFVISPMTGPSSSPFVFDASRSTDKNDSIDDLLVQWDFDNDGFYDTYYSYDKKISRSFPIGSYEITLQVKDTGGKTDTYTKTLDVFQGNTTGSFTDLRDGRTYKTVKIGNQWWMAENLNYGTQIPVEEDMTHNGIVEKYYYENDITLGEIYGGLYQWGEVMNYQQGEGRVQGIAPEGWHIPSTEEWEIMINATGGHHLNNAWKYCEASPYYLWQNYKAQRRTNTTGFTALPGGWCLYWEGIENSQADIFHEIGHYAYFWSYLIQNESQTIQYLPSRYMLYAVHVIVGGGPMGGSSSDYDFGHSVRCVKD